MLHSPHGDETERVSSNTLGLINVKSVEPMGGYLDYEHLLTFTFFLVSQIILIMRLTRTLLSLDFVHHKLKFPLCFDVYDSLLPFQLIGFCVSCCVIHVFSEEDDSCKYQTFSYPSSILATNQCPARDHMT